MEPHDAHVGQSLLGTTWGDAADGRYADYRNGRFAWFKQAKFGIFIHWGVYSLLEGEWQGTEYRGIAEWIMRKLQIPVAEYEKIASTFNPAGFDANRWADLFRTAGAQYVTITAKHHDGFGLFRSDANAFNVVDATPFGRDIIAELGTACGANGLRLCLYYSQDQDWHEPNGGGNGWDFTHSRTDAGRRSYVDGKVIPQLRELLTRYGPIGYIWFDTPGYLSPEEARAVKQTVVACQPECMSSSRLGHNLGDFESLPDQMVPVEIRHDRCETAMTHNDSWAFSQFDHNWKSPDTLIRQLVQTVSCGANYLLNVGPRADGTIPPQTAAALQRIGAWLATNGDSIYGAGPNPLGQHLPWGVVTAKPGRLFLHVMERPLDGRLIVPFVNTAGKASLLADGTPLPFACDAEHTVIDLPATLPDAVVTVIVLDLPAHEPSVPLLMGNQSNVLRATDSTMTPPGNVRHVSWMHETFGNWHHCDVVVLPAAGSSATFRVNALTGGTYRIFATYAFRPSDPDGPRHTLEGPGSIAPACHEPCAGTLAVGNESHGVTFPFVPPGYFENRQVCHDDIQIEQGMQSLSLVARDNGLPEIESLTLVPVANPQTRETTNEPTD